MLRGPDLLRKAIHESRIHLAGDRNNNKVEGFNGSVGDKEKVMGSTKRCGSPIIGGMRMHRNTKPHMS